MSSNINNVGSLKGLALAELYFLRCGLPMLHKSFPAYEKRIAAGLIGDGSDCLGFDDEYSRDHDWGPGFCLWLTAADYQVIGDKLAAAYKSLPSCFEGFRRHTSEWGGGRVGVFEIGAFYRGFIGRATAPMTALEWLRIPEKNLSACTAGKVFHDLLDEFSEMQRVLRGFYPDDVRLAKIAARCMSAGQSGQYNFPRCVLRADSFAAQYAETKFSTDVMSLVYLLNRRYTPYYKWQHLGLIDLPRLGEFTAKAVAALVTASNPQIKAEIIGTLCRAITDELKAEGLSNSDSSFLVDHGPVIHDRIVDPTLRRLDVWAG